MSSEQVAENFGSAKEDLSSNYSNYFSKLLKWAKQKDANQIKYVSVVHRLQKNSDFSEASVSESWYLKTNLCHLRAGTLSKNKLSLGGGLSTF